MYEVGGQTQYQSIFPTSSDKSLHQYKRAPRTQVRYYKDVEIVASPSAIEVGANDSLRQTRQRMRNVELYIKDFNVVVSISKRNQYEVQW